MGLAARARGLRFCSVQVFIDSKYVHHDGGRHLKDHEIAGMLIAVLFAGQHTSSITSSWTGYFMMTNQVRCRSRFLSHRSASASTAGPCLLLSGGMPDFGGVISKTIRVVLSFRPHRQDDHIIRRARQAGHA